MRCRSSVASLLDPAYFTVDWILNGMQASEQRPADSQASALSPGAFSPGAFYSGQPTLSTPCGTTDDGLPLSLQLVGKHLQEGLLCRIGHAYEQATGFNRLRPKV